MIIQIDRYDPQVIEFARAYLDYYQDDWKSVPIHRLASLEFRNKLNEGGYDSVELGIGVDYKLSRFNKKTYELSKVHRRHYDFPEFDGEAILIFLRYIDNHKNYEKEAIIRKFYSEMGPTSEKTFSKRPHHKKKGGNKRSGRKSRRRTHRTRRRN
jgi:hypothetical protein